MQRIKKGTEIFAVAQLRFKLNLSWCLTYKMSFNMNIIESSNNLDSKNIRMGHPFSKYSDGIHISLHLISNP